MRARRGVRTLAVALGCVAAASLAACGNDGEVNDELQVVADPSAASPARAPEPTATPEGTVFGADQGAVTDLATDQETGTLAVAVTDPPRVLLYDLADLAGLQGDEPGRPTTVELPAPAGDLTASQGTLLASVPGADVLARIALPSGSLDTTDVRGGPTGAAVLGDRTLVSLRERRGVAVVEDGRVTTTVEGGLNSADDVVVAGGEPIVLDRLRTAVFAVDLDEQEVGEGLRAGQGATNVATDDFGRVFVADIRRGGLLAFSTDPLMLRQRYPVPGGPYDLAHDPERDLLWVTLTARNEVVGFDVRGGEPRERHRYPTVRQPDSVTVEPRTGQVVVGSATGEGVQVITP
ncbi:hypothetical protein B1813_01360 [Saccharomonospora piscinae]|uniref:Lipoprotein n=1 Tax=Saccharomonospora piscinae TaxID=687388 RepID=A0A1V9ACK6_SACPI|nr:hypothetical protein B1813_01360 [Saccharomonospora piscinae]